MSARRARVLLLLPLAAACASDTGIAPADYAPNLLLITVDTLRPDALGWIGGRNQTPILDGLAAGGFGFPKAVTPVPITLPAHVSLMSGRIPPRHGVRDNGLPVSGWKDLFLGWMKERGIVPAAADARPSPEGNTGTSNRTR